MKTAVPTRTRIIENATMLFWHDGYHAVSTDMICKAAEVTKSSLYNAFPSKAQILAACLDAIWERNWREIRSLYENSRPILENLISHLQWFETSQRDLRARYGRVLGTFDMAVGVSIPADVLLAMKAHQASHAALLQGVVEAILGPTAKAGSVSWFANLIGDMIVSANIAARIENSTAPLTRLPQHARQLLNLYRGD